MKNLTITFFCLFISFSLFGQIQLEKKSIQAGKITSNIKIDGQLDEDAWANAAVAKDFIQLEPIPGKKESTKTEVRILYDNTGIYVSGTMTEASIDSVSTELSARDNMGNVDWFGVFIDSYMDGINGFEFIVTAAGVQWDAKASNNGEDDEWDAIWESAVSVNADGWVAEMKIPYSAVRFPNKEAQTWHINFGRKTARSQEKTFWSEIDPKVSGFLNQSGILTGLSGIKSPLRLSATPFLAVYGQHYKENGKNSYGRSFNGGMDIKYGLNDAFTLDMTLIPDFGEARSDDQILNLSPFEIRFDENRQFFTEGTELFSKGRFFYSRRIGGSPLHQYDVEDQLQEGEEVVSNPVNTQLINASKISGRTSRGLGVGLFNATSAAQHAIIRNAEDEERSFLTAPLTNYNVLVLDQNLKNNSSISFINTTVLRNGNDYDANLSGLVFNLRNKANKYEIGGKAALSQKYAPDDTDLGYTYNLEFSKISGNLTWGLSTVIESDTYDPNDLGFLYNNNERSYDFNINYSIFEPVGVFNRMQVGLWTGYSRLYQPNLDVGLEFNAWWWGQTRSFWNYNFWVYATPTRNYDHFESRNFGHTFRQPRYNNIGMNINSDRRKRLRASINANIGKSSQQGQYSWRLYVGPRFRFSNKLTVGLFGSLDKRLGYQGYATELGSEATNDLQIIFGARDRTTVVGGLYTDYIFNDKMNLSFRLRHYWSQVTYTEFLNLEEDGELSPSTYTGDHNNNFNAFNIDLVYTWRFAPGSDLVVVWKNNIVDFSETMMGNYGDNLNRILSFPQSNTISVKAIYYLDYMRFKKGK